LPFRSRKKTAEAIVRLNRPQELQKEVDYYVDFIASWCLKAEVD
jgi:hypothetical protein